MDDAEDVATDVADLVPSPTKTAAKRTGGTPSLGSLTGKPEKELMQQLYDAGLRQCAVSGVPVFDPSAWTTEQRDAIWQVYVGVAAASDGKEDTERALVAALDKLRGMAAARGVTGDEPA